MAKVLIFLVSLILLVSLIFNLGFIKKFQENNRVVEVVDGDTFQLKSGERVRLMGVDAPEIDRCGGPEAKKILSDLILDKNVELKETVKEAYGRTMGLVYQNGVLINNIMMEEGWGKPDYRKNTQRDALTKSYKEAESKKAGLWSLCINPKSACQIKGNIDVATYQKTYHLPGCSHYEQTVLNTAYGDAWFCTESEAVKAGFVKATGCEYGIDTPTK